MLTLDLSHRQISRRQLVQLLGACTVAASTVPAYGDGDERLPVPLNANPPPLTGGPWLNTPQEKGIDLRERRGKVTILHFWTFG